MDNNFRILHTIKGGQLIVHQKYCFIKDKTSKDGITLYCKCRLSKSLKCDARISIINGVISSASGHHHHEDDTSHIIKTEVKNKLREKTLEEPTRPAKQVYDSVTRDENRRLVDVDLIVMKSMQQWSHLTQLEVLFMLKREN
jgi:hypothetical protein